MDKKMREVGDTNSDIVELTGDNGEKMKFRHLATIDYKNSGFVCLTPAEEIEGIDEEDVVIFKIGGEEGNEYLLPIEDEAFLEEVFNEFCRVMEEEDDADDAYEMEGVDGHCHCGCCEDEDCDCDDEDCDCDDEDCDDEDDDK